MAELVRDYDGNLVPKGYETPHGADPVWQPIRTINLDGHTSPLYDPHAWLAVLTHGQIDLWDHEG